MGWDWVHLVLWPLIGLLYQPLMIDNYGAVGGMRIGRGNGSTRRKPATVQLFPPQIPYDLTQARTRACRCGKPSTNRQGYVTPCSLSLLTMFWNLHRHELTRPTHFTSKMEGIFICEMSAILSISTGFRDRNIYNVLTPHTSITRRQSAESLTMFCSCNQLCTCLVQIGLKKRESNRNAYGLVS
jgi:hypothetical protein